MTRTIATLLAVAGGLALGGCTTFGTNVKGDFACRAPSGTCKPMTVIDAAAVDQLGQERTDADAGDRDMALAPRAVGPGAPVRTGERTLTILLPAYVDEAGVLHDAATVHAVVEPAGWAVAPVRRDVPEISRSSAPSSLREAIAGASAPAIEGLEVQPRAPQHPSPRASSNAPAASLPTAEAISAARAGHRIGQRSLPATPAAPAGPSASPLPRGKVVLKRGDAAAADAKARALAAPTLPNRSGPSSAAHDGDPGDPFGGPGERELPR